MARSTIDTIKLITGLAENAMHGKGSTSKYCAVITLDVQNAFNSARWNLIMRSLAGIRVPSYLTALVDSYLIDRRLWHNRNNGTKECIVSAGVLQGSVLGPLLWNIMYNDVLNVLAASEVTILGYADDIAVIVVAKDLADVELYSSETITAIKKWLKNAGGG